MQYVLWITFTVSDVMTNYIHDNCLNFFGMCVCSYGFKYVGSVEIVVYIDMFINFMAHLFITNLMFSAYFRCTNFFLTAQITLMS